MVTLRELREKIENLESEKARLLEEVETLRKEAEEKAAALECEVAVLREEAEELKNMLDDFQSFKDDDV
jgi:uncharacterized coiled-coil DUF342 family protein